MLNWLIFGVPWPVQVFIILLIALAILYMVGRVFGWGVVKQLALPVLAVVGAIGLYSRARQEGFNARKAEEDKAEEWAENVVVEKHDELRKLPDDALHERTDKWSRH